MTLKNDLKRPKKWGVLTQKKGLEKVLESCVNQYYIHIYMKSGEIIFIDNGFDTKERAQEIYNNMISNDNFSLKENFWNSLCNSY